MGRKHCEKGRNCLLHSYASLVCQNEALCGNGLKYLIQLQFDLNPLPQDPNF